MATPLQLVEQLTDAINAYELKIADLQAEIIRLKALVPPQDRPFTITITGVTKDQVKFL